MAQFSAVLFDLDGTLLDTLDDLADSMNQVLTTMGYHTHPVDSYRYFVGDGMDILAERVLPQARRTPDEIQRCVALMRQVYGGRWHDKTKPYDGIPETIDELRRKGVSAAVLSNKPDDFTRQVVERYFGLTTFSVVMGAGPFPKKPDPSGALEVASRMGIGIDRFLYVGDTATDMRTAVAAGMFALGALWGFRTAEELMGAGAKALLQNPSQIIDYVQ